MGRHASTWGLGFQLLAASKRCTLSVQKKTNLRENMISPKIMNWIKGCPDSSPRLFFKTGKVILVVLPP